MKWHRLNSERQIKVKIEYLLPSGNKLQGCDLISEIHVDPEPDVEGKGVLHSLSWDIEHVYCWKFKFLLW